MLKIMLISTVLLFSGCGWLDNQVNHLSLTVASGDYKVTLYSGGKAVKEWILKDILIQTEHESDGFYWSNNGKITRITGDIVIEEM
jgi:hypothetical protein